MLNSQYELLISYANSHKKLDRLVNMWYAGRQRLRILVQYITIFLIIFLTILPQPAHTVYIFLSGPLYYQFFVARWLFARLYIATPLNNFTASVQCSCICAVCIQKDSSLPPMSFRNKPQL